MGFRPCIDIHAGAVKQIVGSTLTDQQAPVTNFESALDAAHYAAYVDSKGVRRMYKKDGLSGGHVIMLGSSEENRQAALKAIEEYPMGLQIGGGITPQNARHYLDHGASHVIVTSYVFRDGKIDRERLQQLVQAVSKKRLVRYAFKTMLTQRCLI